MIFIAIFLIGNISALNVDNEYRLSFGHVILVSDLSTNPTTIEPGVPAIFSGAIKNTGDSSVNDIRVWLSLPSEIGFFNDVSQKKISRLLTDETGSIEFNLIALPGTSEGVYKANLTVDYLDHVGEERQDSYTISLIVKSKPKMFVQVEDSNVYKGNLLGEITLKFINNDVADIKFLTVELKESEDYEIISPKIVYIGDLDSDDFESIDYKIKSNKKSGEIFIPLKITYKDSLNNPLSDEMGAVLTLYDGTDLGKAQNNNVRNAVIFLIVVGIVYYFYRRWKRKKKREKYS